MALQQRLGVPWIATGDMLRSAIADGTELGKAVQRYVANGELVPDEQMIALIRQRLLQPDAAHGWIMDGYPRTAFQAEELDFLLDELNQQLSRVICLDVPVPVLIARSTARARPDDTADIIQRRIDLYHERTTPILEYYDMKKCLVRVDGTQAVGDVQQAILQTIGL
jgi:adenylate kinase